MCGGRNPCDGRWSCGGRKPWCDSGRGDGHNRGRKSWSGCKSWGRLESWHGHLSCNGNNGCGGCISACRHPWSGHTHLPPTRSLCGGRPGQPRRPTERAPNTRPRKARARAPHWQGGGQMGLCGMNQLTQCQALPSGRRIVNNRLTAGRPRRRAPPGRPNAAAKRRRKQAEVPPPPRRSRRNGRGIAQVRRNLTRLVFGRARPRARVEGVCARPK